MVNGPPQQTNGTVRCVSYARVSTNEQAEEGHSIGVQQAICQRMAKDNGWELVAEYADPGKSGRSEHNRPQLLKMLEQARLPSPPFEAILVSDYSRLHRNTADSTARRAELRRLGIKIKSYREPVEDDGLSGSMHLTLINMMDEHHSNTTAVKVRDGLVANAREGWFNGGIIPYGYELELVEIRRSKAKHKLAICEHEAAFVRTVFDLHNRGWGQTAITEHVNAEGYRTRSTKLWNKSAITKMLSREAYVGRHRHRPTDYLTKKLLPRHEWVTIPCPAILEESVFQNAQRLIKRRNPRNTPPRYTKSKVLLGGIAYCGPCMSNLQLTTGTSGTGEVHRYLKCAKKVNTGFCPGGDPVTISEEKLNQLVMTELVNKLLTKDRVREIVTQAVAMQAEHRGDASSRISALKKQLQLVKRKESNLWEFAASEGVAGRSGFRAKIDALEEESVSLARQIEAQEALVNASVKPLTHAQAEAKASQMRSLILNAPIEERRRFVQSVIEKVIVTSDTITVIGPESTLAETASGAEIVAPPPVRGSAREWCRLEDSNL